LWDQTDELLAKAKANIGKSLARVAAKKFETDAAAGKKFQDETLARISVTTNQEKAASMADLVLEAIIENLSIKQSLFAKLDKVAPASALFASNTSSLSVTEICNGVRPTKFGWLFLFVFV
jgi:3-hydroxyacyl-CoA dehydrogenase